MIRRDLRGQVEDWLLDVRADRRIDEDDRSALPDGGFSAAATAHDGVHNHRQGVLVNPDPVAHSFSQTDCRGKSCKARVLSGLEATVAA